jgi:hypothetical protein
MIRLSFDFAEDNQERAQSGHRIEADPDGED